MGSVGGVWSQEWKLKEPDVFYKSHFDLCDCQNFFFLEIIAATVGVASSKACERGGGTDARKGVSTAPRCRKKLVDIHRSSGYPDKNTGFNILFLQETPRMLPDATSK